MEKFKLLNRIKELYSQKQNIIQYLKDIDGSSNNSIEDILISYDFQSGSYIELFNNNPKFKKKYCFYLAKKIEELGKFESIIEVGIGEATTFGNLLLALRDVPVRKYGFDLSWSRVKYAQKFLESLNIDDVELFTGDLFCIPIKDNAIDIVYTSHSVEPNGGREKEALQELYRITKKYLILLEPSFEFGGLDARERMLKHGYVTNLYSSALELGYQVIEHRLFDISEPRNPTGLLIIKKDSDVSVPNPLSCPITKTDLARENNVYFSKESLLAYPIIKDIPCLLPNNAIIATHFQDK